MAEKRLLILGKNGSGTGTQVQSDWAETDTEAASYIKNKPTISDVEIVRSYWFWFCRLLPNHHITKFYFDNVSVSKSYCCIFIYSHNLIQLVVYKLLHLFLHCFHRQM